MMTTSGAVGRARGAKAGWRKGPPAVAKGIGGGTSARRKSSLAARAHQFAVSQTAKRSGGVTTHAAASPSYDAPSSVSGGTQLESLSKLSEIVRNSVVIDPAFEDGASFKSASCSSAAAVTSRILLKVLRNPVGLRQYEQPIESALAYIENTQPKEKESLGMVHCSLDKAMVNLGSLLSQQVDGRVSTEVDARFANDKDKIIEQVMYLSKLYDEVGVSNDRILYRIPATWAGIEAAKVLEERNLNTLMTLVCSFAQCVAAAEAGVSVVQLYVGRVRDWYKRHPNAIRNPDGPREDAGFASDVDPGHDLVFRCYNYLHKFHPKTKLMAGDIRTKEDALKIAGCDFIVLPPKIINDLGTTPSTLGYNDGLHAAAGEYPSDVPQALSPASALKSDFNDNCVKGYKDEAQFLQSVGECGRDLLQRSLQRYVDSFEQLEPYFTKIAGMRTN